MPDRFDSHADLSPETDRPAESLGELNAARFKPAPEEVRAGANAALERAFPDGKD